MSPHNQTARELRAVANQLATLSATVTRLAREVEWHTSEEVEPYHGKARSPFNGSH